MCLKYWKMGKNILARIALPVRIAARNAAGYVRKKSMIGIASVFHIRGAHHELRT
jgi:hypothetical protein